MTLLKVIVFIAYFSLLLELTIFHVPSKVSLGSSWKNINKRKYFSQFRFLFVLIAFLTFLYPLYRLISEVDSDNKMHWTWLLLGLLLIVIGRIISLVAVFQLRRNNSQKNDDYHLHRKGVYFYSRNPIQIGLYLFLTGLLTLFMNVFFLLGILIYICYMHQVLKEEEAFLEYQFGTPYLDYKKQTSRYF